jgi:hypothetical protein
VENGIGIPCRPPEFEVRIRRDVKVAMRDGVRLSCNLYLPDAPGEFPVVMERSPYGGSGCESGTFYARRGYAFVQQDCRGRFDSEGEFRPFEADARDGYDTLDWLCEQPWCNGRVGMYGLSYMAIVQWLLAPEGHPALQAMVPNVMPCDPWKRGYWCDGAFSLALSSLWLCLEVSSRTSDLDMIPAYDLDRFFRHLPLITMDEYAGRPTQVWRDYVRHSRYDDFWEAVSTHTKYDRIPQPVFLMGGWYDYYAGEAFRAFCGLRDTAASDAIRRRRKIIIGPWSHIISTSPRLGELDFGEASFIDVNALALRWFDALLKDTDTGLLGEPPVTIFVMGANQWRQENEWPLARTQYTDYYLHSGGRAGIEPEDGTLEVRPPGDEPPDRYTYDPDDPVPTVGGNHSICWAAAYHVIAPGPFDQRKVEARQDVLVYSTRPLEAPLEVTGPVRVTLYAATDAPDTDWTAKLVDVHPDGRAMNVTEGVRRARFRQHVHGPPQLIEPGRVYEYTIELQPTSIVFLRGHRIRLDVTSSNFPLWDRNPNTGHEQGMDAELRIAHQTVRHDARHPSWITLPVIPAPQAQESAALP